MTPVYAALALMLIGGCVTLYGSVAESSTPSGIDTGLIAIAGLAVGVFGVALLVGSLIWQSLP